MTIFGEIYFCRHCGNLVRILGEGEGVLICCGSKMQKLEVQEISDNSQIHQIVVKFDSTKNQLEISIGKPQHPMEEAHFISWIEIQWNELSYQHSFDFTHDKIPSLMIPSITLPDTIRIICNQHGLWEKKLKLKQHNFF